MNDTRKKKDVHTSFTTIMFQCMYILYHYRAKENKYKSQTEVLNTKHQSGQQASRIRIREQKNLEKEMHYYQSNVLYI